MKGEEKNVLMRVVWFSYSSGREQVRRPVVIKVEKTAENKWELKIGGNFYCGYPGQNLLFSKEEFYKFSMHGGLYSVTYVHKFRCLRGSLLRDLLLFRDRLRSIKTIEEVKELFKKGLKKVYWGYQGFSYSFDSLIKDLPQNNIIKVKELELIRPCKHDLIRISWGSYGLVEKEFFIRKTLFLEKLKYAYSGEYVERQHPLFSTFVRSHLLGFYMFTVKNLRRSAFGIYDCNERYEEVGIINATYYTPADGDEFRKVADWLQMAGVERKKNGERRKWTLEEECLFQELEQYGSIEVVIKR